MSKSGAFHVPFYKSYLFFWCLLGGGVVGFVFVDLSALFHQQLVTALTSLNGQVADPLAAVEPSLSRVLTGILLMGLPAYLISSMALSAFARRVLKDLIRLLRTRELLPYKFKLARRQTLGHVHENLAEVLGSVVDRLQEAGTEKAKYQEALGKYADPTVAGVLKYRDIDIRIPSSRKRVAVLFADIRGFTPMTENLLPEEVVMILNEHFSSSTRSVVANGGKVNKFIGDAVMAIFEEPPAYKEDQSASRSAVNAGLEMAARFQENALQWATRVSKPVSFGLGVGVHVGQVILGNIGSDERVEYTAIGDTVNLSSRLCSLAKQGQVVVSEECFENVQHFFDAEVQAPVPIKGKTGLYTTYVVKRRSLTH